MLETVLVVLVGLVVGAVAALKLIAPKTQTTLDDKVLARLEQILGLVPGSLKEPTEKAKEDVAAEEEGKPNI